MNRPKQRTLRVQQRLDAVESCLRRGIDTDAAIADELIAHGLISATSSRSAQIQLAGQSRREVQECGTIVTADALTRDRAVIEHRVRCEALMDGAIADRRWRDALEIARDIARTYGVDVDAIVVEHKIDLQSDMLDGLTEAQLELLVRIDPRVRTVLDAQGQAQAPDEGSN